MTPKKDRDHMKRRVPIDPELSDEAMEAAEQQGLTVEEEIEPDKLTAEIAEMQRELEQIKSDAEESHDRYLRTLADFDNFRKRQREESERRTQLAREEIILKLLPIMDNFQRTLAAAEEQHSYDSLVEGVSLTLRQIDEMLAKEGVQQIEAVGCEFDPQLHEAMMRVETDDYPENTIVDELEKGYTLNGKVLRPSRVRVAATE